MEQKKSIRLNSIKMAERLPAQSVGPRSFDQPATGIAECEGQRKPTASTCLKLAAFYALKDKMYPEERVYQSTNYAYMDNKAENYIDYDSGSEFSKRINGRKIEDIIPVMDDLMDALIAINPRLYDSVMRKI